MSNFGSSLQFPCLIFQTQKKMNDYSARDMRYGDLTEEQLKRQYGLTDVGSFCENYSIGDFIAHGQLPNAGIIKWRDPYKMVNKQQSAHVLFDQFRQLSDTFSWWGICTACQKNDHSHAK